MFVIALVFGCDRTPPVVLTPRPPDSSPQQYGIPFSQVPATEDIVMYEVNPRVFSATQNLRGITLRLDSLANLGINVIWLMPIYPTASINSVGSPYAIKDYLSIHEDYGTLPDLRELVSAAHEKGMAVILDWVANHTAWDHDWINFRDWYAQDANGNIIHPPGTNWQDVAELNYNNLAMQAKMIQAMKYWVLEANVDGYRCDFAEGAPGNFWKTAIDTLRSIPNRDIIMFAESGDKSLLSVGFDMMFGWSFYGKIKEVYRAGRSAREVYPTHLSDYTGLAPGKHVVRWITNHDENAWDNVPQHYFVNDNGTFGAFLLVSCMGGVPLVYNGQEVGETRQLPFFEGHSVVINWASRPELVNRYQTFLRFRRQSEALRAGTIADHSSQDVVAFVRTSGAEEVLVLVNVRNAATSFALPPELANSSWENVLQGLQGRDLGEILTMAPLESLVLSRK